MLKNKNCKNLLLKSRGNGKLKRKISSVKKFFVNKKRNCKNKKRQRSWKKCK